LIKKLDMRDLGDIGAGIFEFFEKRGLQSCMELVTLAKRWKR
jgi:hypothetical protein